MAKHPKKPNRPKKKSEEPFYVPLQRQKENPKAKAKAQRRMVDPQERAELRRKEEKRLDRRKLRPDPDEPMRLNRFIAQAGVCSRREADELIRSGKVKVNGQVCTEMGTKVKPKSDQIEYQGKVLTPQNFVYILLNKPKNMITTMSDPLGRRTVLQAVERATKQRVYPVGRLDRNTTGLLLLTNDGELAKRLTHPSYKVRKLYKVRLDRPVTEAHLQALLDGVELEDGPAQVDKVDYVSHSDGSEVGVEIHLGRNRIVRRLFEHLGYRVEALDRIMIGHLDKKSLPRGKWRRLSDKEVGFLKVMVGSK